MLLKQEGVHAIAQVNIKQLDITKTNVAVQELIEVTENARHRYLLQAYDRHRNLEHAGRFGEIFAPEMTVEHPVYRFNMHGQEPMTLEGREQVEPLYRLWAETNQCIFYNESETVSVGDWMVVSTMLGYQQRGRLVGENVWEYDPSEHELIKLDPDDVLTTERAAELLDPHIKPLPSFDESLLPAGASA